MNNQWRQDINRMVVWADGTYDSKRTCDECGQLCSYPVHSDRYKELGFASLGLDDEHYGEGAYWEWLDKVQPLGGSRNEFGEKISIEFYTSNPDGLAETNERNSGVSKDVHKLMQEAFENLTPLQQKVWESVMREQKSLVETAMTLGSSVPNVSMILTRAKSAVSEYLRTRHDVDA